MHARRDIDSVPPDAARDALPMRLWEVTRWGRDGEIVSRSTEVQRHRHGPRGGESD